MDKIQTVKELKEMEEVIDEVCKIEYYINCLKNNFYFIYEIRKFIFYFNEKYKYKPEVAWYFRRDIFEQRSMMSEYQQLMLLKEILMQYSYLKYLESLAKR